MNADNTLLFPTKTENDEDDKVENLFPESNPITAAKSIESTISDSNSELVGTFVALQPDTETSNERKFNKKSESSSSDELPKMKSVEQKVLFNIDKKMNEVKKILNAPSSNSNSNNNNNNNNNNNSNAVQNPLLSSDSNTSSSSSLISLLRAKEQILRRVSFPRNDDELVTGYLEPVDPWACVRLITVPELLDLYIKSCHKHKEKPLKVMIEHIECLDLHSGVRIPLLNLKEQPLSHGSCEALEELFKRVQYKCIDMSSCGLDDVSAGIVFDMVEYYEATNELDISDNHLITNKGWLSCINMVKKSRALQVLSTRGTAISDHHAQLLAQALNTSAIHTLKLEHCGLALRPIASLCSTLKRNTVLKELWLAHNDLTCEDAYHIANLLRTNYHIQFLDISNNNIQDKGVEYIACALIEQSIYFKNVQESKNSSNFNLSDLSKSLYNINNRKNYFPQKSPSADTILLSSVTKATATAKQQAAAAASASNSTKSDDKNCENKKTLESKSDDLIIISKNDEKEILLKSESSPNITEETDSVKNVIVETKQDCNSINTDTNDNTSDDVNNNDDNIVISDFDEQGLQIVEENILVDLTINDENAPPSNLKQNVLNLAPITAAEISLPDEMDLLNENTNGSLDKTPTLTASIANKENIAKKDENKMMKELHLDCDISINNNNNNNNSVKKDNSPPPKDELQLLIDNKTKHKEEKTQHLKVSTPPSLIPIEDIEPAEEIFEVIEEADAGLEVADSLSETLTSSIEIAKSKTPPVMLSSSLDSGVGGSGFDNVFLDSKISFPERSVSSDSLNSEASIDSNDSKSSLKIIESKFARNGTLERHSSQNNHQINDENASTRTGLQVLVLWNNQITRNSAQIIAELIEATSTLEILNVGRNLLCNEFLANIKASLKSNTSLTSIGFQGAHLSDNGAKTLSEVLEFGGNSTLQRIDIRDNNIQTTGLSHINEALKSNKTVTRIDIDDTPRRRAMDITMDTNSEYARLLSGIRAQCARNENPPEQPEPISTSMKRVRQAYMNSRKISLTCHSIKRTSPSRRDDKHLLDPIMSAKSKQGGRLRSPLPSPIPSPIASPVPSPSRNRFQVSRVVEGNTNTSTSPSSTGSSPTLFFPTNSRFRVVTVSEPSFTTIKTATKSTNTTPTPSPVLLPPPDTKATLPFTTTIASTTTTPNHPIVTNTSVNNNSNSINDKLKQAITISSGTSIESPDLEVKRIMVPTTPPSPPIPVLRPPIATLDDSGSSISSSIDSMDNSFDLIVTSPSLSNTEDTLTHHNLKKYNNNLLKIKNNSLSSLDISTSSQESLYGIHDLSTTSTSTTSSSLSNVLLAENLAAPVPNRIPLSASNDSTLTSGQQQNLDKKACDKPPRVRKTSWISPIMSGGQDKKENTSSGAIEKLLGLFQHPGTFFSSKSNQSSPPTSEATPVTSVAPARKESPMGGLFNWASSKKDEDSISKVLRNTSPDNTITSSTPVQNVANVDNIPKQLKAEMKENISPENTITIPAGINSKVIFKLGTNEDEEDESEDDIDTITNKYCGITDFKNNRLATSSSGISSSSAGSDGSPTILGQSVGLIARDSLSILKASNTSSSMDSMQSIDSLPETQPQEIVNQHQSQQHQKPNN